MNLLKVMGYSFIQQPQQIINALICITFQKMVFDAQEESTTQKKNVVQILLLKM